MKKYLLLLFFLLLPHLAFGADFEGGNGTKNNPFLIANHQQLAKLGDYCGAAHQNKFFALSQDIQIPEGIDWQPIGQFISSSDYSGAFQGNLDGRGHQISGLTITTSSTPHVGLFACIANAHLVELRIRDAQISQQVETISTAAILSANSYNCSIRYCSASGEVLSLFNAGGMIGNDLGNNRFEYNFSQSNVSASFFCGGFVGRVSQGGSKYLNCKAEGIITLSHKTNRLFDMFYLGYAGGFIGWHERQAYETATTFIGCSTKSTIKSGSGDKCAYLGGFAGWMSMASLENCSSSGTTQATASSNCCLGGFTAESILTDYTNCTAKGIISAHTGADQAISGGFTGKNDSGSYENCYTDCSVTASLSSSTGESVSGGFIGYNSRYATIHHSYTKGNIEAKSTNAHHVVAGGITGYDRLGKYWNNITLSSIKGGANSANVYIGGIIGHTTTSTLSNNGFASDSSIKINDQPCSLAHQSSNKNGMLIDSLHTVRPWEAAGFSFGNTKEAPWVMPEIESATPILYFEQNPEFNSAFSISPSSIQISRDSTHSVVVSIISPTAWQATSNASWINVLPSDSRIVVTATTNSSPQSRTGTVSITSDGRTRTLVVFQDSDLSPMDKWLVEHGISGSSPQASYSRDGMSNLEKYALGLDPSVKQPSSGTPEIQDGVFQISYPFRQSDDSNLQITGERLADIDNPLTGWTTEGVSISTTENSLIIKSDIPVSTVKSQILRIRFTLKGETMESTSSTTSIPCAYTTSELPQNQQTWINEAVHKPYRYASVIDADQVTLSCSDSRSNTITLNDPSSDFTKIIRKGACYRLEIDFGSTGTVSILINKHAWMNPAKDAWVVSPTSLTFDDNQLAEMLHEESVSPTFIRIREARVISDHFGLKNELGLKQGSVLSADSLFVYSEPTLRKIYYSGSEWKGTGIPSSGTIASMPLTPHKPTHIQRKKGTDVELTIVGEILRTPQIITLSTREETVSTELPISQNLRSTDLEKSFEESLSPTNSDGVFLLQPDPAAKYYYYNGAWRLRSNSGSDVGDTIIHGILTIYKRTENGKHATIFPLLTPSDNNKQ